MVLNDTVGDTFDADIHSIFKKLEEDRASQRDFGSGHGWWDHFLVPIEAFVLDDSEEARNYDYYAKIFNTYKFFTKYVLIYTPENYAPEEFLKKFGEEKAYWALKTLNAVYITILKKKKNHTNVMTMKLPKGSVMVSGFIFSPELRSSLYKKTQGRVQSVFLPI